MDFSLNINENSGLNISSSLSNDQNLDLVLKELRSNIAKGKLKKVLDEIISLKETYAEHSQKWRLDDLKISTKQKSFYKAFYFKDKSVIWDDNYERHLGEIDSLINDWENEITKIDLDEDCKIEIEFIITHYLVQLYFYAIISRNNKKINDCSAFLGIGEKLINFFSDRTNNIRFLDFSSRILLFQSSILISDENYITAQKYQNRSIVLSFRITNLLNNHNEVLNINNLNNPNKLMIENAFLNIVIALFHRGYCEDKLGNIAKSCEAYKQSRWFSKKMINIVHPELYKFISDTEERAEKNRQKLNTEKKKEIKIITASKKTNPNFEEIENLNKLYEGTIKNIENVKFQEFYSDRNLKNDKVKDILYTVEMTNNFLSTNFRDLVVELDNINVHKIEKNVSEKISKVITQIRNQQAFEKLSQPPKSKSKCDLFRKQASNLSLMSERNHYFKKGFNFPEKTQTEISKKDTNNNTSIKYETLSEVEKQINYLNLKKVCSTSLLKNKYDSDLFFNPNKKNYNTVNKYIVPDKALQFIQSFENFDSFNEQTPKIQTINSAKNMKVKEISKKKKKGVEAYPFDKYISNKSYQEKIMKLDCNLKKEFDFQKKILKTKKSEKIIPDNFNKEKISQGFFLNLSKAIKSQNTSESKSKRDSENPFERKEKQLKSNLERQIIKSLDSKNMDELKNLKNKKSDKLRESSSDENVNKIKQVKEINFTEINEKNDKKMKKIESELELLERTHKEKLKSLKKTQTKTQVKNRKKICNVEKKPLNSNFVKIRTFFNLNTINSQQLSTRSKKPSVIPLF